MGTKLSKSARQEIAQMPLEELVKFTRELGITAIGANYRLLLNEFALRFNMPTDGISFAILRPTSKQGFDIWQWGIYSEARVEAFRAMPGRKWNNGDKCNSFTAENEHDPVIFETLKDQYAKIVIIDETGFRVDDGNAVAEWSNRLLYDLSEQPLTVNLADVLDAFYNLRPQDHPHVIAIHGEYDDRFRTLFDESLPADEETLENIEITTRHKYLLFRVPQTDGKPRYFIHSAVECCGVKVLFADSKELDQCLAQFKETQQRLAAPLIENSTLSVIMPSDPGPTVPHSSNNDCDLS